MFLRQSFQVSVIDGKNEELIGDLKELIKEKDFGTVNEDDSFTSKIGNYKIEFEEIEGWE